MPLNTMQDWVDATRRHLMSGRQEPRNVLAANYTPGSGTVSLGAALTGVVAGARLSIGFNTMQVLSVNNANLTATVVAGQEGSSDAAATTGTVVKVAPRFTDFDIWEALVTELSDLSAPENGLFQVLYTDLTFNNAAVGYDLTTTLPVLDIYNVRVQEAGSQLGWVDLQRIEYDFDNAADTAVFPSGQSLMIYGSAYQGLKVRVLYRAGFTAPGSPSPATALSTTGLPATAYDIPPMGAAMRLVYPREVKRNFTEAQGDTRRAGEVQAGAVANSATSLARLRQQRISAEAGRLKARYPDRRR
jgi:hypothetical protein